MYQLGTAARPSEIPTWMANHRKPAALEQAPWESGKGKVGKFGRKMRDWWTALQPEWRGSDWPLSRAVADGESWTELKKGGSTGFVLIIIGLNWWIRDAQTAKDQNEVASMVEDVVFVLKAVLETVDEPAGESQSKTKR